MKYKHIVDMTHWQDRMFSANKSELSHSRSDRGIAGAEMSAICLCFYTLISAYEHGCIFIRAISKFFINKVSMSVDLLLIEGDLSVFVYQLILDEDGLNKINCCLTLYLWL